jgi:type I restriction enzyme M protein
LSDVFGDEVGHLAEEFGAASTAARLVEEDHRLVRFFLPQRARWESIAKKTTGLGQELTDAVRAVAKEKPKLQAGQEDARFPGESTSRRLQERARSPSARG